MIRDDTVDVIANRAGVSVLRRGALFLIRSEDCSAFVREADAAGALVLGIEGFRVNKDALIPQMDAIADFSSVESPERSTEAAERFLGRAAAPGLWFDFTFGDRASSRDTQRR